MKRILLPLLFCFLLSFAQEHTDKLFTPEELKADADYYFKTLYDRHPDPYYYYSLEEFEDKKNEIYSQLEKPLTKEQFGWIIGEINAYVDWHSTIHGTCYASFSKNPYDVLLQEKMNLFPTVRMKENKLFLADNLKKNITEINGIPVKEILSDVWNYFNRKLPQEQTIYIMEAFLPFYFANKYKFTPPYKVKFHNSSKIKILNSISLDEFLVHNVGGAVNARGITKNNIDSMKIYSYKIYPTSSSAIFYIKSFDIHYKDAFDNALKEFTEEVNNLKIKYIFYDLSRNDGGHYLGCNALNIIKHDTVYFRRTEIERQNGFNKKSDMNEIVLHPNNDSSIPSDRKLFVFQSTSTWSGGDYFCRIVAENKLGVLVGGNTGEPTVAFSYCLSYEMPHSKINFDIATKLVDFSDYFDSETLQPDIYWDIYHNREFTEQELINIINYQNKHVQIK
jgi:hypothetical protein